MTVLKMMAAGLLLASSAAVVRGPLAQADPLIPLTSAEIQYLDQLRRVFSVSRDREAFNSDGELLDRGRYACYQRDVNQTVGFEATLVSPAITQLAFVYLCPK